MRSRRTVVRAAGTVLTLGTVGCLGGGGGGGGGDGGNGDGAYGGGGSDGEGTTTGDGGGATGGDLGLSSSAFAEGEPIPTRFTCEGENVSPPLRVSGVPDGAAALALVVDDPDAPTETPFVHWLLWNVPPDATEVPEGVPRGETVDSLDGARQGINDAGSVGYTGPCPPPDDGSHTYRFTLHALDAELDVPAGAERPALDEALGGASLGSTRLTGEFDR